MKILCRGVITEAEWCDCCQGYFCPVCHLLLPPDFDRNKSDAAEEMKRHGHAYFETE